MHNDGVSTGPLTIASNGTSQALGIAGTDDSGDPTAGVVGADTNPRTSNGIFGILTRLENALRTGNNAELTRLGDMVETELDRFRQVQGEVGNRLQLVDRVDDQLTDGELHMRETLSGELDTNMSEAILEISQRQAAMQATMQVAASALRLSLWSYL